MAIKSFFLYEMTRPEVEAALAGGVDTAVATFGSTEQHGLHLPLGEVKLVAYSDLAAFVEAVYFG